MKQELPITQKLLGVYFLLSILMTSCSQNEQVSQNVLADKDIFQPPVIVPAGAPRIIRLDSCPPPVTITKLPPPETTAANFTVPVHSYNTTNGLAGFSVTGICEDKKGRLWFGTSGGVSCYDGKSFRNFTMAQGLASNDIRCILEDRKGNIWIGSWLGGISCYDGRSFKNYLNYPDLDPRVISMIEDKSGIIWIGTTSGLFSFDGKSFTKHYGSEREDIANDIQTIFEDKKGKLWFSTPEGLVCYDRKSFKIYTQKDGLANNYILSIFEDKSGFLWIGTAKGLSRFDGSSFKNYTTANGLPENFITGIIEKKNGQLLVRTLNSLLLYNDTSFVKINFEAGHFNFFAKGILEDKNGSLWLGHSSGVSRYDGNFISLMDASVNRISEDKAGNLWFSNFPNGGVSRYNGNSLSQYFLPKEVPYVLTLLPDKKRNLWIGTGNRGIYQLDSTGNLLKYYDTAQGLPHWPVYYMLEDRKENLWFIPDGGGVWQLNKDRSSFAIYNEGFVFGTCRCMLEDKKGNLWFGTWHGLSRLDSAKKFFTNYSIEQGLSHDEIRSICEDKNGFIWVGTRRGICRYDGKSFLNFTTDDGMLNDDAQSIVEDTTGAIWIGTALGFCHLKFKLKNEGTENTIIEADNALSNDELKVKYEPLFDFFNYGNGFPVKDVHLNAMCVDTKGTIWTGSDKVVRLDYNSKYKDPNSPNVFIQSIKINNENIPWYDLSKENLKFDSITVPSNITEETIVFGRKLNKTDRDSLRKKYGGVRFDSIKPFYSVPVNLILPYASNNITFDFVAIEPARPNLVRYQYILEGYDKQWSPVTEKSSAGFGNMHEGNYTFKLKAQSPDGVWSKPIVYTFKVLPPWYRTWWAYSLYTLIFLIALFSFIRWRVRTLRKEKIILEEKVALRTHELKKEKEKVETTLAGLKTAQAQLIQSEKMASLGELTAGIAHEIQNPLNFVNNFSEVNGELIEELRGERSKVRSERDEDLEDEIISDIKQNLEKINHHGKRADAIVKGMLQHSKTSTGEKELTDINKLANEYLRLAYHGLRAKDKSFNSEIKTDFDESMGKINIIPQDIGRVLLNLFNNAFYAVKEKFAAHGSQLAADYKPLVSIQTKKLNDTIEIRVSDNGSGIPQNIIDKIFQPFFTTKPTGQGTGLGLSLAYDIIKAHGGEIKVESKEGEGSVFIIQLPITA